MEQQHTHGVACAAALGLDAEPPVRKNPIVVTVVSPAANLIQLDNRHVDNRRRLQSEATTRPSSGFVLLVQTH